MISFVSNPVISKDMEEIFQRTESWCDLRNSTVLITGAYGMLASYLTGYLIWLNEQKHWNITIIAMVRNAEKARERFGSAVDRDYFQLHVNPILTPLELSCSVDYIIHAAGIANPKVYGISPVDVAQTNVLGTYYLLQWASVHPIKGFLLFSTGDVYGKVDCADNIIEDTVGHVDHLDIHNCYGESKRMAETWCASFFHQYGIRTMMARIAHTYSPFVDIKNDPRVFASFVNCAIEGRNIDILSDGSAKRPFCYITDAIVGYLLILMKGEPGEPYNVSNTDGFYSIAELAQIIAQIPSPPVGVNILGKRTDGYLENKDNKQNLLSGEKLQRLGWEHIVTIEEGFRRVIQYQQEKYNLNLVN